jgi:cytochrome c oxidase assembly factor CtaG
MTGSLAGRASRISTQTSQSRNVIVPNLLHAAGSAPPSGTLDTSWTFPPVVLLALVAYLAVYGARWRRSRAEGGARAASGWRGASWVGGVLLLAIALVSPVDVLGEQMASWHMLQHLLIADLAPILLILGLTKWLLRPATRRIHRIERAAGPFGHPIFGVVAYVVAMWLWHIPVFYDAALAHSSVHSLEHTSFFAAGSLYWWHLLSPIRSRLRMPGLGPVAYMASTKLLVGFLGIVLAFSNTTLYSYAWAGHRMGMTPLEDQNVAGLFMALEQSIVMGIALAWLFARMLAESEAEEQRAERYGAA